MGVCVSHVMTSLGIRLCAMPERQSICMLAKKKKNIKKNASKYLILSLNPQTLKRIPVQLHTSHPAFGFPHFLTNNSSYTFLRSDQARLTRTQNRLCASARVCGSHSKPSPPPANPRLPPPATCGERSDGRGCRCTEVAAGSHGHVIRCDRNRSCQDASMTERRGQHICSQTHSRGEGGTSGRGWGGGGNEGMD